MPIWKEFIFYTKIVFSEFFRYDGLAKRKYDWKVSLKNLFKNIKILDAHTSN